MPEAVLEFKANDGAWYAGTAEFEGPYLRVHFEHFPKEEDERWLPQKFKTVQDVKKMIRPASQPMQDFQCSDLRRGMFLCVACRRPGTDCFEYYDAKLQQFNRSPHKRLSDGQESCTCEFEVEWLGGSFRHRRQFVSCGDICLRTPGDIGDDPVIKEYIAEVKSLKVSRSLSSIDASDKDINSPSKKRKVESPRDERMQQASKGYEKEHFMSVKDQKGFYTSLQCGESSKQTAGVNVACTDQPSLKTLHHNTLPREKNGKGYEKEHFMSGKDQKGFYTSLQCGESSKQAGGINVACTDEPSLKMLHHNTLPRDKIAEPSFSCRDVLPKHHVDVIQIDSDNEEEPDEVKDALPAKITEAFSRSKMNEGMKSNDDELVNDDKKSQATSHLKMNEGMKSNDDKLVNNDKKSQATSPSKMNEGMKSNDDELANDDKKSQATSPIAKSLVDEFSGHDFSGLSKEHSFPCGGNMAACSCIALQKHCFKRKSCECEAVGFIPISSCHLTNICSHSKCGHRRCKFSSRRIRKSGHAFAFSATSQVCDKLDHSQAGNAMHSQVYEDGGDTKESIKDNNGEYLREGAKGLFHFLLVENLEKDIVPSKALKAVRKVSSGAVSVYIWPSVEYETTRRAYLVYQDSKAAEAAYLNFSAGKFIVTSRKGRPWIIRRHKLDWILPHSIGAMGMFKEEKKEAGKEELEDKDLRIIYKGTEEYTIAIGKQKLFVEQQDKLRRCYESFSDEEEVLEAAK